MNVCPNVTLYVDGSYYPTTGDAGIGIVMVFEHKRHEKGFYIGRVDSPLQAEIQAVIGGLALLRSRHQVRLVSDCQKLINTARIGFQNDECWQPLASITQGHKIHWCWVSKSGKNPGNTRADELARQANRQRRLFTGSRL